mgnify:CR=1 FL=1
MSLIFFYFLLHHIYDSKGVVYNQINEDSITRRHQFFWNITVPLYKPIGLLTNMWLEYRKILRRLIRLKSLTKHIHLFNLAESCLSFFVAHLTKVNKSTKNNWRPPSNKDVTIKFWKILILREKEIPSLLFNVVLS